MRRPDRRAKRAKAADLGGHPTANPKPKEDIGSLPGIEKEGQARPMGPNAFAAQGFGSILNYNFNGTVSKNTVRSTFVIVEKAGDGQIALHHFSELMPGRNAPIQDAPTKGLSLK